MYAFISNEYRTVVSTQRQLDFLLSIYSYPKFKKVATMAEAKQFFSEQDRDYIYQSTIKYGAKDKISYIRIEYFISDNNIYCNVRTDHFGFIKLHRAPDNVKQDSGYDLLKIKICNVVLDNNLIAHHCLAISNILRLFDDELNVELVLPDISVYLACTKYTGKNFVIKNTKNFLQSRVGNVYYTIK